MLSRFLLAAVFAAFPAFSSAHSERPRLETLYDYSIGPTGISFRVYSGGCTSKRDFRLVTFGAAPTKVALYRAVGDFCLALLPRGVVIRYSMAELGASRGDGFLVVNPIRRW